MASQEHPLYQQSHNTSDFEVAHSLLQHSRGGREVDGDRMPIATDNHTSNSIRLTERSTTGAGLISGQGDRRSNSQERQADAQYDPISNQNALGQVCR